MGALLPRRQDNDRPYAQGQGNRDGAVFCERMGSFCNVGFRLARPLDF